MPRPRKLRIGWLWRYTLRWVRDINYDPPADGFHDGQKQEITLCTLATPEVQRITALHEVLHGIIGVQYNGILRIEDGQEELLCHSLGKGLYQFLSDPENKSFLEWLIGVDVQS